MVATSYDLQQVLPVTDLADVWVHKWNIQSNPWCGWVISACYHWLKVLNEDLLYSTLGPSTYTSVVEGLHCC